MSNSVFRLHSLPAGNGDALVVEYGAAGQARRVLIDGGVTKASQAVEDFLGRDAVLELMVVTHIDNDHIAGLLKLLNHPQRPRPKDVWFNGYRHLPGSSAEAMGPVEGERLTELIRERRYPWNCAFRGAAITTTTAPPTQLADGLCCRVLSPGVPQLQVLRQRSTWTQVVREAGLDPAVEPPTALPELPTSRLERMGSLDIDALADERTPEDTAPANGSTIALLVDFQNRSCLLAGDAHPGVLIAGVDQIVGPNRVLDVDVFKLPHHGSKANVTKELLRRVRAHTYVFSTDGSGNQRHPDDQAVARVIKYGGESPLLCFNYRSQRNCQWDDPALKARYHYRTQYPENGTSGVTVNIVNADASMA